MSDVARDVQEGTPEHRISLGRVGVVGVRKLVVRRRAGAMNALSATIDVFIDLGRAKKGIHMSRCTDTIDEVIEEGAEREVADVEEFCSEAARRLLQRHLEATRAEVVLRASYPRERATPATGRRSQEVYGLIGRAVARRLDGAVAVRRSIGVEVVGLLACPCAQELMRERALAALLSEGLGGEAAERAVAAIPVASHNQRGRAELEVGLPEGAPRVEADVLIDVAEEAFSSPVYEVLKRPDEAAVVERAHARPRFVEDAARAMAGGVAQRFPELPDGALVSARTESMESIHRHDAVAECVLSLGQVRAELAGRAARGRSYRSLGEWMG